MKETISGSQYLLALDQGTTSSRAIIFNRSGKPVSMVQKEFKQYYPQPGWVEHDPMEILKTQRGAASESLQAANLSVWDIVSAGITNQRETVLVWDRKSGEPVYPAIVWQDRRTADYCRRLKEENNENWIREKTGLVLDPYFSGTKVSWILENVEGAYQKAEMGELILGTIDTWLIWNLTGGCIHVTDISNACRTLLFNIHKLDWDEDLLDLFKIPRQMLPEVKGSCEFYGEIAEDSVLGGIKLVGSAGDQQAALFGQACFDQGMVKNTYGTGCFLLMNTGREPVVSENNLLTTIAWKIGNEVNYALEGSVFMGGAVVQWLRDELKMVQSARECDALAASVDDTGGFYLVPAFTGLGAPHWDPYARGAAFGMTRGTGRAQFCRAALESIAFQSGDLIRAMEKDAGFTLTELRVDGGASRSEPLMQFQADLLQKQVVRAGIVETTALGAAYLAGLGVGFYKDLDDIRGGWSEAGRFEAQRSPEEMEELHSGWQKAVERSRGWAC